MKLTEAQRAPTDGEMIALDDVKRVLNGMLKSGNDLRTQGWSDCLLAVHMRLLDLDRVKAKCVHCGGYGFYLSRGKHPVTGQYPGPDGFMLPCKFCQPSEGTEPACPDQHTASETQTQDKP